MISKPLLKATTKQNYIVFFIILAVLMMYLPIIISMYDPTTQENLNEMLAMLPQELVSAMGFTGAGNTLLSFIATYFYGFLILLLPMIYSVIVCNRSLASLVDKGSMAYLLSTPNTRSKIARTQAVFIFASITLLLSFVTAIGIVLCEIQFPDALDIPGFILLNFGALLLYYALTGIGFFASALFNDTKHSLMVGAGLPVGFLVIKMISEVGESTEVFKYVTLYSLFNPQKIVAGETYIASFVVLGIIAIVTYVVGMIVFQKRDLPL
mgnify:CR=1 FL=1